MQQQIHSFTSQDILTSVSICCLQLHYWLDMSFFTEKGLMPLFSNTFLGVCIFCIFIKWMSISTMNIGQFMLLVLVMASACVGLLISGGLFVFKTLLFALAVRGMPFDRLLKVFLRINLLVGGIIVGASLLGVISNVILIHGIQYMTLGFRNPNHLAAFLFVLVCLVNYLYYSKIRIGTLVCEGIGTYALYVFTTSRAPTATLSMMILFIFVDKYMIRFPNLFSWRITKAVLYGLFPVFSIISYYIGKQGVNLVRGNLLLSWRPYLWGQYVNSTYPILLGTNLDLASMPTLDNGYLFLLYHYGIVVWFLFFVIFIFAIKNALEKKDAAMLVLVLAYEIYFMAEAVPLHVNLCIVVLYSLHSFWQKHTRYSVKGRKSFHERRNQRYHSGI